jgi:cation:H+ antiporter
MSELYLPILALIAGLIGLVWSADKFVNGSVGVAKSFGISSLVIGLTVVSIGTSAPEIIVSINAALKDSGGLAVGNAIGSNLANIGLVLGITTLIAPIPVKKYLLKEESPILLIITALAGFCLYDSQLNRFESMTLGILVVPILIYMVKSKKTHNDQTNDVVQNEIKDINIKISATCLFAGLLGLLVGSEVTVWGAKSIASYFNVSDLIIGLTVIAIGTSLPELAASVVSAVRGHHDIALGNIFGSNLFNILLVMTTAGVISPITLPESVFFRDYAALAGMTSLMIGIVFISLFRTKRQKQGAYISRIFGVLLLTAYFSYYIILWPSMAAA